MKDFSLSLPINPVSFGQLSTAVCRELFGRNIYPACWPLDGPNLETQKHDPKFDEYINKIVNEAPLKHSRDNKCFSLWHLVPNSMSSWSKHGNNLLTFHELDKPTDFELKIASNCNIVYFSSEYSCDIFRAAGANNIKYLPLFFDSHNFKRLNKKFFNDDRITFSLCGKFEKRKHHAKILQAWAKKYGNDKRYYLNAALYNTFLKPEENQAAVFGSLGNQQYFNMNFVSRMGPNEIYNDFLNSADIVIGMSGGEGWGLPEFQSLAMGKHGVILNAHAYKGWANETNAVMVNPSGKIPAYDGRFFKEGGPVNQGEIFDWKEDDFIDACEEAIKRHQNNPVNEEGLKLQEEFPVSKTVDLILEDL
jgi:hypothetical protein